MVLPINRMPSCHARLQLMMQSRDRTETHVRFEPIELVKKERANLVVDETVEIFED